MKQENKFSLWKFLFKIFQGAFVGLGAVLPGISGGVLCVIFGIYKTIMEFLADPFKNLKHMCQDFCHTA
jgi:putative membrane protein